ncbi:hypothetical protein BDZ97DRAFT_1402021 [Flammula alnicola]|nr:hypothetical protein BDZ97DRAFT_1402021 [Flammula alnicola]
MSSFSPRTSFRDGHARGGSESKATGTHVRPNGAEGSAALVCCATCSFIPEGRGSTLSHFDPFFFHIDKLILTTATYFARYFARYSRFLFLISQSSFPILGPKIDSPSPNATFPRRPVSPTQGNINPISKRHLPKFVSNFVPFPRSTHSIERPFEIRDMSWIELKENRGDKGCRTSAYAWDCART